MPPTPEPPLVSRESYLIGDLLNSIVRAEVTLLEESRRLGRLCPGCQVPLGTGEIEAGQCWRCEHGLPRSDPQVPESP
jgi:hypothetical protein